MRGFVGVARDQRLVAPNDVLRALALHRGVALARFALEDPLRADSAAAVAALHALGLETILLSGDAAREIRQNYGAFLSGLVALTLNAGAYITEIFRAGIQSIDRGQTEAARSLGMSYGQTMKFVIVPQAFRRMLPPLGNEAIMLLKDSSLVSAIGLAELAFAARTVAGVYSRYWEPYLTISLVYLVLTLAMAAGVNWLEKRYQIAHHR